MRMKINNNIFNEIINNKILNILFVFIAVIIFAITYSNDIQSIEYFEFINNIFVSTPYGSLITIIVGLFLNILLFNSFLNNSLLEQRFSSKKELFNYIMKFYLKLSLMILIFISFNIVIFSNLFSGFNVNFLIEGKININIFLLLLNLYLTFINISIWFFISTIILNYTKEKVGILIIIFLALYQYINPYIFNVRVIFPYFKNNYNLYLVFLAPLILLFFHFLARYIYIKRKWEIR